MTILGNFQKTFIFLITSIGIAKLGYGGQVDSVADSLQDLSSFKSSASRPLFKFNLDQLRECYYPYRLPIIQQRYNILRPTIFISYAWEAGVNEWVSQVLSQDFKRLGFEVLVDQEGHKIGNRLSYFEGKISQATYVAMICTPQYLKRLKEHDPSDPFKSTGVGREVKLIGQRIQNPYQIKGKVFPLFRGNSFEDCVPDVVKQIMAYSINQESDYYKAIFNLSQELFLLEDTEAFFLHQLRDQFLNRPICLDQSQKGTTLIKAVNPKAQVVSLQQQSLKADVDTQQASLIDEKKLYQQLIDNAYGEELHLKLFSPTTAQSFLIFDALKFTQSLKVLDLEGATLTDMAMMALSVALSHNSSLEILNLKDIPCSRKALRYLALGLKQQWSLQELIILPTSPSHLTTQDIEQFYQEISSNSVLKKIVWPASKPLLEMLCTLAKSSNRVAALHIGIKNWEDFCSKTQGISFSVLSKPFENLHKLKESALKYLCQADDLGHPIASYELGKIYEQEKNNQLAFQAFQRAFNLNYPKAQVWMGHYHRGLWKKGPCEPNYPQAFLCYQAASLNGQEEGIYSLGRLYEKGHTDEEMCLEQAEANYLKAAAKGYPESFIALIRLYGTPGLPLYNLEKSYHYQDLSQHFTLSSQMQWKLQGLAKTLALTNLG